MKPNWFDLLYARVFWGVNEQTYMKIYNQAVNDVTKVLNKYTQFDDKNWNYYHIKIKDYKEIIKHGQETTNG